MGNKSESPKLSDQEKKLVGSQTELLDQARGIITGAHGDFQTAFPELLRLAGFQAQGPANAEKVQERLKLKEDRLAKARAAGASSGTIAQLEADIKGARDQLNTISSISTIPGSNRLNLDKVPEGANHLEALRKLTQQSFNTLTKNLRTFDPNRPDPFVEEQLRLAREAETERLASRMGPGADVSSAGIESLGRLGLNEILSRDAARRQNYEAQLRQFSTLGTLGLQSSGEIFNRQAALRGERNQKALTQEGFRQQRLGDLSSLLQMPLAFAGPLGGTASGFGSPLAAYAGARQPAGPGAGAALAGMGGGALAGAATGATLGSVVPGIGTGIGAAGGALIGGLGPLLAGF